MSKLRIGVIGTGHLGKIHARLLAGQTEAKLAAIVDPNPDTRQAISQEHHVPGLESIDQVMDLVDAVVIATPTNSHHEIAMQMLSHGKHVLIEKPIAFSPTESQQIIDLSRANQLIAQVGHVERFNPAFLAARREIQNVRYMEMQRTSTFTGRSTDIGVVFDLMIHDIDLMLSLVESTVVDVQALGISVFGDHEDLAQARITFANGTVANLNASRCSFVAERAIKLYGSNGYVQADLTSRKLKRVCVPADIQGKQLIFNRLSPEAKAGFAERLFEQILPMSELEIPASNAIADEHQDFIRAIATGQPVAVPAQDGHDAVVVAKRILDAIRQHTWSDDPFGARGPLVSVDQMMPQPQRRVA